jgi:hypothetical protein
MLSHTFAPSGCHQGEGKVLGDKEQMCLSFLLISPPALFLLLLEDWILHLKQLYYNKIISVIFSRQNLSFRPPVY